MIDADKPIEFVNGHDAYIVGVLSRSGSCIHPPSGIQEYSDAYAELWEQGVRFMVATDHRARKGGCVDDNGAPVSPWYSDFFPTKTAVRNRSMELDTAGMDASDMWGMF